MKNKKATNKQIMDAYGQSYRLMQKAKQHDDILQKKPGVEVTVLPKGKI